MRKVYVYRVVGNRLELEQIGNLNFPGYSYCRSIKIINGFMYFATDTPNIVYKVNYIDGSFSIVDSFQLPPHIVNLVDVDYFNGNFYVTSYSDINKSPDLINFASIYNDMGLVDVPYFTTLIDGKLFFTEVGESRNAIHSIDTNGAHKTYFKFDGLEERSIKRRDMYPR